jgi:transcriptional regulator with XRE-family HTH domain
MVRKAMGGEADDLAAILGRHGQGVEGSTLLAIENGERNPTVALIGALADACEMTAAELLGERWPHHGGLTEYDRMSWQVDLSHPEGNHEKYADLITKSAQAPSRAGSLS